MFRFVTSSLSASWLGARTRLDPARSTLRRRGDLLPFCRTRYVYRLAVRPTDSRCPHFPGARDRPVGRGDGGDWRDSWARVPACPATEASGCAPQREHRARPVHGLAADPRPARRGSAPRRYSAPSSPARPHALELFCGRVKDPLGRAEVAEERPRRPAHAVELIEHEFRVAASRARGGTWPRRGGPRHGSAPAAAGRESDPGGPARRDRDEHLLDRFASAITATRGRSSASIASGAAESCPCRRRSRRVSAAGDRLVPLAEAGSADRREKRRRIPSRIAAKSSSPSSPRPWSSR